MKQIKSIKIKISKESNGYFIEGKIGDLNHFGQGITRDEAIYNYFKSFIWTLDAHMKNYGNLNEIFGK